MPRWKARVEFLLSVIELVFLSLTFEALEGKTCQNSLLSGVVGHLEPRFQAKGVVPGEYFFGFYKTRHILLSDSANCTVLRAVVLTQYRRVTDGWTDGQTDRIAIASTTLAMRALRRAVKCFSFWGFRPQTPFPWFYCWISLGTSTFDPSNKNLSNPALWSSQLSVPLVTAQAPPITPAVCLIYSCTPHIGQYKVTTQRTIDVSTTSHHSLVVRRSP